MFETGAEVKFEVNLKVMFDRVTQHLNLISHSLVYTFSLNPVYYLSFVCLKDRQKINIPA